jgi:cytochrome c553
MNRSYRTLAVAVIAATLVAVATAREFPGWAYPVNPAGGQPAADDGSLRHVPESTVALTHRQIATIAGPVPDWHPDEHPPMPEIVGKGRAPQVFACGYCHLPNGAGRPENTSLAGLTPAYIKEQMQSFRNGDRPGSEPKRAPQTAMISLAKAATDVEIEAAAAYFSSLKPARFVRVIETATVPKTSVAGWMLVTAQGGGTEPIGNRIIEVAEDHERFEYRDSRTPYLAFVPVGSIKRGAELVATGRGDKLQLCVTCHGPELRGQADIPRLAGRSPSYIIRQLYDLRGDRRKGGNAELMKPVVANLTDEDMVALAAYLSSREP